MTTTADTRQGISPAVVLPCCSKGLAMIRTRFTYFGVTKEIARIEGYRTVEGCEVADVVTRDGRRYPVPMVLIEQF